MAGSKLTGKQWAHSTSPDSGPGALLSSEHLSTQLCMLGPPGVGGTDLYPARSSLIHAFPSSSSVSPSILVRPKSPFESQGGYFKSINFIKTRKYQAC